MERYGVRGSSIRNKRLALGNRGYVMVTTIILVGAVMILLSVCLYIYNTITVATLQGSKRNVLSVTARSLYNAVSRRINKDHYLYAINRTDEEKNKCFLLKVLYTTDRWTSIDDWKADNCPSGTNATSETVDGVEKYPDFVYKTEDGQTVYIKLVNSSAGNTGIDKENLLNVSGTSALLAGTQSVEPPPLPYIYKIIILVKDKTESSALKFVGLYFY